MKSTEEIERLFEQTSVPYIVEGPHREQLKRRLLVEPASIEGEKKLRVFVLQRMSPALKFAAGIFLAAFLVGVGWAAERIYHHLKFTKASLSLEEHSGQDWSLPNGMKMRMTGSAETVVNPDDPKAVETARRHYDEMKKLVAQKKYKLVKTYENEFSGGTEYVYGFTFSDGSRDDMNFSMPLEDVASWDDYQRKVQQQTQHYQEQVNKAITSGKYRLVDKDVILMHICLETASQKKFRVQRILPPKGNAIALYHPYEISSEARATTKPQSSWREHLQAVREGKLKLLDVETIFTYTYEVIFEDGTKRFFNCGGDDPLKGAKPK